MVDTLVNIILGSLGTAIGLASFCIAYLQYQRSHARKECEVHLSMNDIERLHHIQELPAAGPPGVRSAENTAIMKAECACGDVGASGVVALSDPCSFCRESKLRMLGIPEASEARNAMDPARADNQILARQHSALPSVPGVNGRIGRILEGNGSAGVVMFERRPLNARSTTLP